ncbi:MAG: hypothetical protein RXP30_02015 [Thermoplasmata archaeon]|jgi:hypothetical protein|nr:hypothetical protein [Euryarchaeota archaeon]MVT14263.1 hypothetical protein [Euryarchaeota archaeon]MVT36333.1 hypothetical protein [Euryarchaeota archaeon]
MYFLNPFQAAVASSLVVVLYGIFYERRTPSSTSILFNLMSFLVILASIDLPPLVFLFLLLYVLLGYIIVKIKIKSLYFIFGSKSFGSLMLVLILGSHSYFFGIYTPLSVTISWLVVGIIVHLISYLVK